MTHDPNTTVWVGYSVAPAAAGRVHPLEIVAFANKADAIEWQLAAPRDERVSQRAIAEVPVE